MTEAIGYAVEAGVAVLSIQNPPVNALSQPVRSGLMEAIDRAEEDDAVRQIVVIGAGGSFPAGADLNEYETGFAEPSLRDLCERVEYCEKPVIVALHGTVYGGGLELALACHFRLAVKSARLSLPEVRLGLTPAAGGTQRLPRLVGAKRALDFMLSAAVLQVDAPEARGIVDGLTEGDLREAALRFAAMVESKDMPLRRLSEETRGFDDMGAYMAALAEARQTLAQDQGEAPALIVDLVEAAALLPFEAGLAMEDDIFESCMASDTARALRHAFVAERRASRFALPDMPAVPRIDTIAVLGAGPLALQIAISALNAGIGVHWGTRDPARAAEGAAQLRAVFAQGVAGGGLTEAGAEARLARLKTGESGQMIEGADMILHAAPGQGDVPAPADMIRAVAMAGRVDELGLRFAPPVFKTRLVEVVQGPQGRPDQIAAALGLASRMGKVAVHVRSSGDSIAGRLSATLHRACDGLVGLGADPYAIDAALHAWGWPVMPFQSRDLTGLDAMAKATRGEGATNWSALLLDQGRKGQSGEAGFYRWSDDGPAADPELAALLATKRQARDWAADDLVALVLGAVANDGLRMLGSGMARRASDIDVVGVLAMQFPRLQGGPMKAVTLRGLFEVMTRMKRLGHPDDAFWQPDQRWADLVKNGKTFDAV